MAEKVTLYVYDLSNGMARQMGQMLVGKHIEGIWHTSLVLHGMEVFYGQGIDIATPGMTHHGQPMKQLPMGETYIDRDTFLEYVQGMRDVYTADKYHLLDFNCNSFTNDVLGFLNGNQIPEDILNLPKEILSTPFGQRMRPMIDQMFRGSSRSEAANAVQSMLPPAASSTPSQQSLSSNLEICTSPASMRTTLDSNPAVAVMFTSNTCPPCNVIKPYFEELARTHGQGSKRIVFVIVEMGLGGGAQVAQEAAFGGPIRATPTIVLFARGKKIGECKGADRGELKTQVQLLEMEVYPAHKHTNLDLPTLVKLSKSLAPITYPTFPPLPSLSTKLSAFLPENELKLEASTRGVLTKRVIAYLAALPTPPAPPSTAAPLDTWIPATLNALTVLEQSKWFPILDCWRLALARDSTRLSASAQFFTFLPQLLKTTASDLEASDKALILTLVRLVSNLLPASALSNLITDPKGPLLQDVTKIIIRALLDPDKNVRSSGAGLAWSLIGRIYDSRISSTRSEEEEWQIEITSALVEALEREEESVEVVHRLTAGIALLLYQNQISEGVEELLSVLGVEKVLEGKIELVKGNTEVEGIFRDMKSLMAS